METTAGDPLMLGLTIPHIFTPPSPSVLSWWRGVHVARPQQMWPPSLTSLLRSPLYIICEREDDGRERSLLVSYTVLWLMHLH